MMGLLKELGKTWRSVASVVLAYGIIAALFFYNPHALNWAIGVANEGYNQSREFTSNLSEQAAVLFGLTISPGSVFITLMILFVRVVVLSILLWISGGIIRLVFGREKSERY